LIKERGCSRALESTFERRIVEDCWVGVSQKYISSDTRSFGKSKVNSQELRFKVENYYERVTQKYISIDMKGQLLVFMSTVDMSPGVVVVTSTLPPIDVISEARPLLGLPPAAIPNPRKSRVVCFGANMEWFPLISSFNPEFPSQGSPRPSPAAIDTPSGSTRLWWFRAKLSCWAAAEEDDTKLKPRSNEAFDAAAPT